MGGGREGERSSSQVKYSTRALRFTFFHLSSILFIYPLLSLFLSSIFFIHQLYHLSVFIPLHISSSLLVPFLPSSPLFIYPFFISPLIMSHLISSHLLSSMYSFYLSFSCPLFCFYLSSHHV